jgi:hypothetical protein
MVSSCGTTIFCVKVMAFLFQRYNLDNDTVDRTVHFCFGQPSSQGVCHPPVPYGSAPPGTCPHRRRTCYQYARSLLFTLMVLPSGRDGFATGTPFHDVCRNIPTTSRMSTAHTFDYPKLVTLTIPKRECRATPLFIPRLKPWAFSRLFL